MTWNHYKFSNEKVQECSKTAELFLLAHSCEPLWEVQQMQNGDFFPDLSQMFS